METTQEGKPKYLFFSFVFFNFTNVYLLISYVYVHHHHHTETSSMTIATMMATVTDGHQHMVPSTGDFYLLFFDDVGYGWPPYDDGHP